MVPSVPSNHSLLATPQAVRDALQNGAAVVLYLKSGRFHRLSSISGQPKTVTLERGKRGKITESKVVSIYFAASFIVHRYENTVENSLVAEYSATVPPSPTPEPESKKEAPKMPKLSSRQQAVIDDLSAASPDEFRFIPCDSDTMYRESLVNPKERRKAVRGRILKNTVSSLVEKGLLVRSIRTDRPDLHSKRTSREAVYTLPGVLPPACPDYVPPPLNTLRLERDLLVNKNAMDEQVLQLLALADKLFGRVSVLSNDPEEVQTFDELLGYTARREAAAWREELKAALSDPEQMIVIADDWGDWKEFQVQPDGTVLKTTGERRRKDWSTTTPFPEALREVTRESSYTPRLLRPRNGQD